MDEAVAEIEEVKNYFKDKKKLIIKLRKNFKKRQVKVFEDDECAVCLETIPDLDKIVLRCGHIFHHQCVSKLVDVRYEEREFEIKKTRE